MNAKYPPVANICAAMALFTVGAAVFLFTASNSDWRAVGLSCNGLAAMIYNMGIRRGPLTRWDFQRGLLACLVVLLLGGALFLLRDRLPWNRTIFRCGVVVFWLVLMALLTFAWRRSCRSSNPYKLLTRT